MLAIRSQRVNQRSNHMRSTNEQIPRQHLAAGSSIGVSRLVVVVDRSAVIDIRLPTMGHKTGI
jgi:transcriptional regulator of NAD metabolism